MGRSIKFKAKRKEIFLEAAKTQPFTLPEEQLQKFWTHVNKDTTDGCWLWTGALATGGYGYSELFHDHLAHRITYQLVHGILSPELNVTHMCRNRNCVNPKHLCAVTDFGRQQNAYYKKLARKKRMIEHAKTRRSKKDIQ